MIRRCRRFVCGLTLLSLCVMKIAIAQRDNTAGQTSESREPSSFPDGVKSKTSNIRTTSDQWAPPDIDAVALPIARAAGCPLPDVISLAGRRVQELVHNVDRFSATEVILHRTVSGSGNLRSPESDVFNYVYSMKEAPDGYVISEESRVQTDSRNGFPDQVLTTGTPGLVLVFHPNYVSNFRMTCQGLGNWQGQPAWQVRFEQLPDATHHMSVIIMDRKTYDIRFRGIAWILEDSYQVVHMEMDLAETIPKIRLRLDHEVVDYRPVFFPDSDTKIWLPSSAELYMDFRGHRFYRRHTYTNFKLFSVKVQEEFGIPR